MLAAMKSNLLLESIATSLDDARAAAAGGAQRFELCSALALGGVTPSLGTLRTVKRELRLPVMCMIRPRECGMAYSDAEFETMLEDARIAVDAGADGLVFGFLTEEGEIDLRRCREFLRVPQQSGRKVETVFHRAFDVAARPREALEQLIDLGVTRVLTSGRAPSALAGADQIRQTIEQARGRIEVLPGGAIDLGNLEQVVRKTGADQVHVYLTRVERDPSAAGNPEIRFGAQTPPDDLHHLRVDREKVGQAAALLSRVGPS